jgi:hypothetical protein
MAHGYSISGSHNLNCTISFPNGVSSVGTIPSFGAFIMSSSCLRNIDGLFSDSRASILDNILSRSTERVHLSSLCGDRKSHATVLLGPWLQ